MGMSFFNHALTKTSWEAAFKPVHTDKVPSRQWRVARAHGL